jgi:tRNA threonylcarbamoyladenosine biosynthesis protein TsaB
MRVLAIDTCLSACSVAVLDGDRVTASACEPMDRGHQERLAPLAREVMAQAGLAFADLDRIAVTLGPGSFTGLRVGLAFAKGLGLALERPVIGLGCLEVLAAPYADSPGRTLALLPGRGDGVCHQAFEGGAALGAPGLTTAAGLEALAPVARIVGAADLAGDALPGAVRLPSASPDAAVAARLAVPATPAPLAPLYMRPPNARLPGGRLPA